MSYNQVGGLIAPAVAELTELVTKLDSIAQLKSQRIAFVAHSRGGLIVRSLLVAAAADLERLPTSWLALPRLSQMTSPHLGSGVASLAARVERLLASLQAGFASLGITTPAFLKAMRFTTGSPAFPELALGSRTVAIAPGEPVSGIAYHTFGGTSTAFSRLWASVYTVDGSTRCSGRYHFHWGSTPILVGTPLDLISFCPLWHPFLHPFRSLRRDSGNVDCTGCYRPEKIDPRLGDLLVTDVNAHLPFSTTRYQPAQSRGSIVGYDFTGAGSCHPVSLADPNGSGELGGGSRRYWLMNDQCRECDPCRGPSSGFTSIRPAPKPICLQSISWAGRPSSSGSTG